MEDRSTRTHTLHTIGSGADTRRTVTGRSTGSGLLDTQHTTHRTAHEVALCRGVRSGTDAGLRHHVSMPPSSRSQSAATTALTAGICELFKVMLLREIPQWWILGRCGPPRLPHGHMPAGAGVEPYSTRFEVLDTFYGFIRDLYRILSSAATGSARELA